MATVAELQAALADSGSKTPLTRTSLVPVPTGSGGMVTIALADPGELAAQAGLTREAYALARCIQSEGYGGATIGRAAAAVAIGQAIRNGARASGKSIERKLTASTFGAAAGYFGEQSGRYASTAQDPTRWAGQVATAVLGGELPDLARGAKQFLDMKVFARGEQNGRQLRPIKSVLTSWMIDGGASWVGQIPTVDPFHLVLLGDSGASHAMRQAQLAELLDIYERGKAGDSGPAGGDPDDDGGLFSLTNLTVLALACGVAYYAAQAGWFS